MGGMIGAYQIPYIEITEAASISTMIVARYNGRTTIDALAHELGLAKAGGGFRVKLTSLKGYGLITGRGNIETTDLANKIATTKDTILANRAVGTAFLNYPLFNSIFNQFGDKVPDEEALVNVLVNITKASRIDVSKKAGEILRYYATGAQFLKGLKPDVQDQQAQIANEDSLQEGEETVSQMMVHTPPKPLGGLDEIIMGDVRIYLKPDLDDVETAKGLLAVYEKKLRKPKVDQSGSSSNVNFR